jgi:ComF family protein
MTPLLGAKVGGEPLLVPVPLHRRRIASRGFNQALLIAREMARRRDVEVAHRLLRRQRPTPPLKGMSFAQRRRTVAGAFRIDPKAKLAGRTVVLVDDVLTTGSTANACARVLQRAGAARVELICWARVVRSPQFER